MNYHLFREFEWDSQKSERCFRERGFDFAYSTQVFLDSGALLSPDHRFVYGEPRYQITGMIAHRLFVVVFTLRSDRIRIISARKANLRERKLYEDNPIYH